ncbi:MAG: aspartate--tRNA ligase [Acidobacteriota bacterium]|nr:aspartate--tRNA ligase [Acidobacteriota bacterium]
MSDETNPLLHRTVGCGQISEADAESARSVVLTGWVHRRRDLGQLIFIELRDATGTVQVVFDPSRHPEAHAVAESLRAEFVVGVSGVVARREAPNPDHPTGAFEIVAERAVLHNRAEFVPFPVADSREASEEVRLKHRTVDLRRPLLQRTLQTRHRLGQAARGLLNESGFLEVETPILTRSTPEGARDYLVPSRVQPGSFFALPQSPQIFKQLLMVAGFDRYYQFARCFRDEDLRADRQPEFTQIDIEMSFVEASDVRKLIEGLMTEMFAVIGVEVHTPFQRMPYDEAMSRFGSDRPDLRFDLELQDLGDAAVGTGFRVFDDVLAAGGSVQGIRVPGAGDASRKQLDAWTEVARKAGAGGLIWIKRVGDKLTSSALKVLGEERCTRIADLLAVADGDVALIVSDKLAVCRAALGTLRVHVAHERGLVEKDAWRLVWIEDFPLVEWDEDAGRWFACHHPFTAPHWDHLERLQSDPGAVRAQAYDLVLNGTEIGGGSIRIHQRDVQERVFAALDIGEEEAESKFGFLLRGLQAGAPPHGGIAMGFDRICAMLSGVDSIRDVIAFPKTTRANCLLTGSPAQVDEAQLAELGIALRVDPETS